MKGRLKIVETVQIGLMGLGTVGSGVYRILQQNGPRIEKKLGTRLIVKRVLEKVPEKIQALGIEPEFVAADFRELVEDPDIKIVVELIGGLEPARSFMVEALKRGKHVVTANKDCIALHGKDLFAAAREGSSDFYFEASVGGGIPIILPLKQSLAANNIKEIIGIVNGTTNYILTKMAAEKRPFEDVLQEAQELGYAESDPAADIEGLDAARKMAILASIGFGTRVALSDVFVEGITGISPQDIEYGHELGYVLKLLGIAKEEDGEVEVRVHPAFLPARHPLAAVDDVYNAIFVRGDAVGQTMFYGRGAGQMPTGSAVVGDLMEIARNLRYGSCGRITCTCLDEKPIRPMGELINKYYIRLLVRDNPGVMASIAGVFAHRNVSLASVIQKRTIGAMAEIVLVTHEVKEQAIQEALKTLGGMSIVSKINSVIRVERGA
jgi:homoserine dehydrogenase